MNEQDLEKRLRSVKDGPQPEAPQSLRTFVRQVEEAIASGDKKAAQDAFRAAQPELMRGAQKKVVHRNAVARKLSRLSARIKQL